MSSVDTEKAAPPPPTATVVPPPPPPPPPAKDYSSLDVVLRILLFGSTLAAVVVMVTSKQTVAIPVTGFSFLVPVAAKFYHSPAFIYFVAALSVICLYSIITMLASFLFLSKPGCSTKTILHFAILDVVMLGLAASATGTAGAVGYIGLKGNSHVNWDKVCNVYGKFCRHVGGSLAVSLVASVLLVLLVWLSLHTIHSRIRKY